MPTEPARREPRGEVHHPVPPEARLPLVLVILVLVGAVVGVIAMLAPWRDDASSSPTSTVASPTATTSDDVTDPPTETTSPAAGDTVFTIGAVGDVLPHDTPIATARDDAGGEGYDFRPMLEATRPFTEGVDLMLCNFEVPLSMPAETPSGYPLFGAPTEIVGNLADLGVDGCSTGTNHTLDRGADNAAYTLDVFDEEGLGHAGSARSQTEADSPQLYVLERGGQSITVAQVGGSYGTNGLPIPADAPYVIDLLDADRLISQARAAREAGADIVVATLHWGVEYQLEPNEEQTTLAQTLADSGVVDLVVGTHPHVPQPYALLDGGPDGTGMWVAWSLGNFISNQDSFCCLSQTATGLFMTATVTLSPDGPARVTGLAWTPITVDRLGGHRAYPLLDLAAGERPAALELSDATIAQRLEEVQAIMARSTGAEFPMLDEPSEPTGDPPTVPPRPR